MSGRGHIVCPRPKAPSRTPNTHPIMTIIVQKMEVKTSKQKYTIHILTRNIESGLALFHSHKFPSKFFEGSFGQVVIRARCNHYHMSVFSLHVSCLPHKYSKTFKSVHFFHSTSWAAQEATTNVETHFLRSSLGRFR